LILDDASPDNTEEVGSELARRDPRVTFRKHGANQGHIATYNEGLAWATADYTLLLSADDLLTPGSLRRSTRLMDAHPEVAFTHGRAIKTGEPDPAGYRECDHVTWEIIPGRRFFRSICETSENIVETPTAVVRTSLQHKVGGYRKELPHAGDLEMWLRLSLHGSVGYLNADQAYYRLHGQNMSAGYYRNIGDLLQRKAVFDVLFREYHGLIKGWSPMRRRVARVLAEEAFWKANAAFDRGEVRACQPYLDFAVTTCRALQYWPAWWRLRLKRLIGPRTSGGLRSLGRWLRGLPGIRRPGNEG
jgi:glycosyltransferase involved in cell wall biosynthesis